MNGAHAGHQRNCTHDRQNRLRTCTILDQSDHNFIKLKQVLHGEIERVSVPPMERIEFVAKVKQVFDGLPGQIRVAAGFVLDNPQDVALLSMREQARRAGVPPATMTRFAQHLGLAGYDEVRAIHADAIREKPEAYGGRAQNLVRRHREVGVAAVSAEMAAHLAGHLSDLGGPSRTAQLIDMAQDLIAARRIFCLGHRSSFPAAFQFNYLLSFFDDRSILLNAGGGIGHPAILNAGPGDALLAICYTPAAKQVVETVAFARRQGVRILAITDSETNPIGRMADRTVLVSSRSLSFFDTITPAFAACEILVALVAGLHPGDVPAAVARTEEKLWELGVWWNPDDPLPPSTPDAGTPDGEPH